MTRDDHWTPRAIMDRADARHRAKPADEALAAAHEAISIEQRHSIEEGARADKAEAQRDQLVDKYASLAVNYETITDNYETLLIRLRESEAKRQALQEALREAVAALEAMRAPHAPRKRMAAQERADGLYEYRPIDPWGMA